MIQKESESNILTNGAGSYAYEVEVPEGIIWEEVKLEEVPEELRPGYIAPELEE
ncbi:MAG: hypothetical protein JXQ69_03730 [Paludibacteraceae bacterium]|nr:hypothetical protein [Paludibacteraceae bacterium]